MVQQDSLLAEAITSMSGPPTIYLTKPQGLGLIINLLLKGDITVRDIQAKMETYPNVKLSSSVLDDVKRYLHERGAISIQDEEKAKHVKGRPRKIITLKSRHPYLEAVAQKWEEFAERHLVPKEEHA